MILNSVTAKSALSPCGIEGIDYTVNPYIGCGHSCAYCYAEFMRRFSGHESERWGAFVDVKSNLPELLTREIERKKPGSVWLSSVTDCYQPAEKQHGLTRKVLEAFYASDRGRQFDISVLTKSSLAERDFDLFKTLDVEFGMTINTLNDRYRKAIEPFASSAAERLRLLKKAKDVGLHTYAFIGPVLPGITDLDALFCELTDVEYLFVEMLNTKTSVMTRLVPLMKRLFPEEFKAWEPLLGDREAYYIRLRKEVEDLGAKYGVPIKGVISH